MNQVMWGEMLDVLKNIGDYLQKQDATQERAKIQKPPKISENQADIPIVGGEQMPGKPGTGVAKSLKKSYPEDVPPSQPNVDEEIDSEGDSMNKEEEDLEAGLEEGGYGEEEEPREDEEEDDEYEEEEEEEEGMGGGPDMEDVAELKSLLKDIRSSLIAQSKPKAEQFSKSIATELKKSIQPLIREETQRMMRKMGFRPSRPDVVRFGLDGSEILQKSVDTGKSEKELEQVINDLENKSWQQLGQMREGLGHFNPFAPR